MTYGGGVLESTPDGPLVAYSDYARLKAEVERLTELNATLSLRYDATKSMLDGCAKEIEEMEAEVESLMTNPTSRLLRAEREENARLKEEVEHLTSENLLVREEADRYCRLWQEAKEGKQP